MRLSLHCVGGFTGPAGAQTRSVDVDRLPASEAERVRALVAGLGLERLPADLLKARPQPWDFLYTLTVTNGSVQECRFHMDNAPDGLRALVELLERYPPQQR
jgi:hypothetical protein